MYGSFGRYATVKKYRKMRNNDDNKISGYLWGRER